MIIIKIKCPEPDRNLFRCFCTSVCVIACMSVHTVLVEVKAPDKAPCISPFITALK